MTIIGDYQTEVRAHFITVEKGRFPGGGLTGTFLKTGWNRFRPARRPIQRAGREPDAPAKTGRQPPGRCRTTGIRIPANPAGRALGCLPVRKEISWGLPTGKNRHGKGSIYGRLPVIHRRGWPVAYRGAGTGIPPGADYPPGRRQIEIGLGDGSVGSYGPGDARLVEDTTGQGHTTRVVGSLPSTMAVIPLAD